MDKLEQLKLVSDPGVAALNAYNYYESLGVDSPDMNQLFGVSNHKVKKYKVFGAFTKINIFTLVIFDIMTLPNQKMMNTVKII